VTESLRPHPHPESFRGFPWKGRECHRTCHCSGQCGGILPLRPEGSPYGKGELEGVCVADVK